MLRMVGILSLSVAVGLVGFLYCERLTARKKYLEGLILFAVNCSGMMRTSHMSIFDIFKEQGAKELRFLQSVDKETVKSKTAMLKLLDDFGVKEQDKAIIAEFLTQLGGGDAREQAEYCEYYKGRFEQLFNDAKKDADEKGRLLRSLFMLAGAALFILLI